MKKTDLSFVEAADYYDRVEEDDLKALEQLERAIDIEPADVDYPSWLSIIFATRIMKHQVNTIDDC